MRFRDDKPHANHKSVVESIIQSIADGVEKETVSPISKFSFFSLTTLRSCSSGVRLSEMLGRPG